MTAYIRFPGSRLGDGFPAAHRTHRLMLLGSPPDMVHGDLLRGTGSSSLLTGRNTTHATPWGRDSSLL